MNSKQIHQNKVTNNSQESLTKEDLDIRLARQIQLYSQALSKFKIQAHYHENVSYFINQLRKTNDSLKNNSIHTKSTSLANPQTKLKQLIIQTTINNHPNFNSKKLKQSKITTQNKRRREGIQSDHLKEILDIKSIIDQQRQIGNLADRLNQLYEKIGEEMKQDCLCEKVMIKIRKQSSIRANVQCLSQVQKQIKKYHSWKREKQHLIKLQNIKKGVQDKLLHNLEHMKNIMNKKINNNDYIYQSLQSANPQNLQRILATFVRQHQLNRQTYQQHLTNSLADKAKNVRVQQYQKLIFNIQKVESYFKEVDSTINLIESYDLQYLEKENLIRTRMQEISRRQCGYKQ